MSAIVKFVGEYRFLSNFFPAEVWLCDIAYPTVEHGYQAAKTIDDKQRAQIAALATPGQAKRAGRRITLRNNWPNIKLTMMHHLLKQKFNIPELEEMLIDTGDRWLAEGNTWGDRYWGVCDGRGLNHLGKMLMDIRSTKTRKMVV